MPGPEARSRCGNGDRASAKRSAPMPASRKAMDWTRRAPVSRFTKGGPKNAAIMPPIAGPATSGACGGTLGERDGAACVARANASVTTLTERLIGMADLAAKPTECISTGRRNSPPPKPSDQPGQRSDRDAPSRTRGGSSGRTACSASKRNVLSSLRHALPATSSSSQRDTATSPENASCRNRRSRTSRR